MKKTIPLAILMSLTLGILAVGQDSTFFPSFHHRWNPQVGSGATYRVSDAEGVSVETTFAVVGQVGESLQFEMTSKEPIGMMTMRMQVTGDPMNDEAVEELIFQAEGDQPVLMDQETLRVLLARKSDMAASIGDMGGGGAKGIGARGGEVVSHGEEKIRTLAGEYVCQKFTLGGTERPTTVWFNDQVTPFGVVRLRSGMEELELLRLETGQVTRIKGTPLKVDTRTIMMGQEEATGTVETMDVDVYDQDDLDKLEEEKKDTPKPAPAPEETTP